jgi:hypothetical protein
MKQMETTKKKIGDNTFYIKPFPAFKAAYITGLLAKTIGPLLGGLGGLANKGIKGDSEEVDVEAIMNSDMEDVLPALAGALSEIEPEQLENLIQRLCVDYKNVSVSGEITNNDVEILTYDLANEVFCGELVDMVRLCVEVCKVNFGGFFSKLNIQSGSLQGYTETLKRVLGNGENSTSAGSAS